MSSQFQLHHHLCKCPPFSLSFTATGQRRENQLTINLNREKTEERWKERKSRKRSKKNSSSYLSLNHFPAHFLTTERRRLRQSTIRLFNLSQHRLKLSRINSRLSNLYLLSKKYPTQISDYLIKKLIDVTLIWFRT